MANGDLFQKQSGVWVKVGNISGAAGTSGANGINAPLVMGIVMNTGATGTNVGPILIAPRASTFTKCKVVTKASDNLTNLTFTVKQNGTSIFINPLTISAGTASGTVNTFLSLTSNPLSIAADDLFTIDITSGTSTWVFTLQLE